MKVEKKRKLCLFLLIALAAAVFTGITMFCLFGMKQRKPATEPDFSTKKLLLGIDSKRNLNAPGGTVICSYGNTYLLSFDTEDATRNAYEQYKNTANFIDTDAYVYLSKTEGTPDDSDVLTQITNSSNDKKDEKTDPKDTVAMISTGITGEADKVSVIDDYAESEEGTRLAMLIRKQNPKIRLISVQAFDKEGTATSASIYAAIETAINKGAGTIVLPFSTTNLPGTTAVNAAIKDAVDKGVTIVGAAGDKDIEALYAMPGSNESTLVVGACDNNGEKLHSSNYGQSVDYNVVGDDTAEAAATMAGYITKNGALVDNKTVFSTEGKTTETADNSNDVGSLLDTDVDELSEGVSISGYTSDANLTDSVKEAAKQYADIDADASVILPSEINGQNFVITGSRTGSNTIGLKLNGKDGNGTGKITVTPTNISNNGENSEVTFHIVADTQQGQAEADYTFKTRDTKEKTGITVTTENRQETPADTSGNNTTDNTDTSVSSASAVSVSTSSGAAASPVNNTDTSAPKDDASKNDDTSSVSDSSTSASVSSSSAEIAPTKDTENTSSSVSDSTVSTVTDTNQTTITDASENTDTTKTVKETVTTVSEKPDNARLFIEADDNRSVESAIADTNGTILGQSDDAYLVQYDTKKEAVKAKNDLKKEGLVQTDTADFTVADQNNSGESSIPMSTVQNPLTAVENADRARSGCTVALIDTGASGSNVKASVSIVGDDGADRNGHGTKMANLITEQNPDVSILSIKALDDNGKGTPSTIYAAIRYAIDQKVKVINLSLSGIRTEEQTAVENIIKEAVSDGITVVGAAGNNRSDASAFIPGGINEVIVAGACNESGTRLSNSNYGKTIDWYVKSGATSEAAAILSGQLSTGKEIAADGKLVFSPDRVNEDKKAGTAKEDIQKLPVDTTKNAVVKYLMINVDQMNGNETIDSVMKENCTKVITQFQNSVPLYKNADGTYSFIADTVFANGYASGGVLDAVFANANNDGEVLTDGVSYDRTTHIATVSADALDKKEDDFANIQLQLLVPASMSNPQVTVAVHMEDAKGQKIDSKVIGSPYEFLSFTLPGMPDGGCRIRINDNPDPIGTESYTLHDGTLTIQQNTAAISSLDIKFDGTFDSTFIAQVDGAATGGQVDGLPVLAYIDADAGSLIVGQATDTDVVLGSSAYPAWPEDSVQIGDANTVGKLNGDGGGKLGVLGISTSAFNMDFQFRNADKSSMGDWIDGYNHGLFGHCFHTSRSVGRGSTRIRKATLRVLQKTQNSDGSTDIVFGIETNDALAFAGRHQTLPQTVGCTFKLEYFAQNGYVTGSKSSSNSAYTDGDSYYSLSGAVYYIYDINGNYVASLTTDINGNTPKVQLKPGQYTAIEQSTSPGYRLDDGRDCDKGPSTLKHAFTVAPGNDASFTSVEPYYNHGQINIYKEDKITGYELQGAEFTLYERNSSGKWYSRGLLYNDGSHYWTDVLHETYMNNKYGSEFKIVETKTPLAHRDKAGNISLAKESDSRFIQEFTLSGDVNHVVDNVTVRNQNTKVQIKVEKKDEVHPETMVSGATLRMYKWNNKKKAFDESSAVTLKETSTGVYECDFLPDETNEGKFRIVEGHLSNGKLVQNADELPVKYSGHVDMQHTISSAGTQETYTWDCYNHIEPQHARVSIKKTDLESGNSLEGATFKIYEHDLKADKWIYYTTMVWNKSSKMYELPSETDMLGYYDNSSAAYTYYGHYNAGKYVIVEEKAPTGYVTEHPTDGFTNPDTGVKFKYWDVSFNNTDTPKKVTKLKDKATPNTPTSIYLQKVDAEGNPLNGVVFRYGNASDDITTYKTATTSSVMVDTNADGKADTMMDGIIKIQRIKPGTWQIQETDVSKAQVYDKDHQGVAIGDPGGYHLDDTWNQFYVSNNGLLKSASAALVRTNTIGSVSVGKNGQKSDGRTDTEWGNYLVFRQTNYTEYPLHLIKYADMENNLYTITANGYKKKTGETNYAANELHDPSVKKDTYTDITDNSVKAVLNSIVYTYNDDGSVQSQYPWTIGQKFPYGMKFSIYEYSASDKNVDTNGYKTTPVSVMEYSEKAGMFVDEQTASGDNPKEIMLRYTPDNQGKFMVKETAATAGYIPDKTVKYITIPSTPDKNQYNRMREVRFTNTPNEFAINKIDTSGNKVAGCQFRIWKDPIDGSADDGEVFLQTNKDNDCTIFALPSGTWHYQEISVPKGFSIDSNTYDFTVAADGTIENKPYKKVTRINTRQALLKVLKEDTTDQYLNDFPDGTEFYIYEWDANKGAYSNVPSKKLIYKKQS